MLIQILFACGEELPPIPDGLAELEPNTASFPSEPGLDVVSGEEDDYDWVHAAGLVDAPVSEVWAAIQVEDVFIDRRQVNEWAVTHDTEDEYDVSFVVHNTVHDVITVEYDTAWRQSQVYVTEDSELVAVRFEKIDGTDVIERMVASLHLEEVDGQTRWSFVEHLKALQRGPEPIVIFAEDFFDETVLTLEGEDLPDYSSDDED